MASLYLWWHPRASCGVEAGELERDVAGTAECRDCASLAQERLYMRMHSRYMCAHEL